MADDFIELRDQLRVKAPRVMRRTLADAMQLVMETFETRQKREHMSDRTEDSVGPRTGDLRRALKTRVAVDRTGVTGEFYFDGDRRLQTYAQVQEEGATIRPRTSKGLTFRLERRFARGSWPFRGATQWITVKRPVEIPPRLHAQETFDEVLEDPGEEIIGAALEAAAEEILDVGA